MLCKEYEAHIAPGMPGGKDSQQDHIVPWSQREFRLDTPRSAVIQNYQEGLQLACPICNPAKGNKPWP
jgi:hypothetical protein